MKTENEIIIELLQTLLEKIYKRQPFFGDDSYTRIELAIEDTLKEYQQKSGN